MKNNRTITTILLGLSLILVLLYLLTSIPAPTVYADTYAVTNTNASGPGSLRQSILDANARSGHDTIDFSVSGTIILTSSLPAITDNLTITGLGAELLAVSGNNAYRVFEISAGSAVIITGLTVQEGYILDSNGGGIWNEGELHLENMRVISNTAAGSSPNGYGGGLYTRVVSPTLNNVTFNGNQAANNGGGMYNASGNPTLNNVTFSNNQAKYGGGMHNYWYSDPTLNNVTFNGNSAATDGGGMFNYNYNNPTLNNVTFSSNQAANDGGGLYNLRENNATLNNVIFNGNQAANNGGGMYDYLGGYNSGGRFILNNVTFSGNQANNGGGMYNYNNNTPTLNNVTFSGNQAISTGGGMYNTGSIPTLNNAILWGNAAGNAVGFADAQLSNVNWAYINHSLVEGGCPTATDCYALLSAVDPQFIAPLPANAAPTTGGNYRLQSTSPAINAGNNAALPGSVTTDLDGKPRIAGGQIDLGPYELFGLALSKQANVSTATVGQRITYTLSALNAYTDTITGAVISDTLPSGLSFAGPITLDPPGAGIAGSTPPRLAYDLSIAVDESITITFPVTVTTGLPAGTIIINTATITSQQTPNPITAQHSFFLNGIIHVDRNATGNHTGASWADAFTTLQDALDIATLGDEIWVAQGVYMPTNAIDRSATFALPEGVPLYGGFAATETARSQRNWITNVTILSGDIDQNDYNADNNFIAEDTGDIQGDNAYHVVSSDGVSATAVLDGFTITAGQANGSQPYERGAGMYNLYSNPTLNNISFSGNYATWGGGMCNTNSNPTLNNVAVKGNEADNGGGIYNNTSAPTLNNVTINGNYANWGGGIFNYNNSSPMLINVTFSGNQAANNGGGMLNYNNSNPTLTNTILWGNAASAGAQMANINSSSAAINYSLVEGGCPTDATCDAQLLTADPQFQAPLSASAAPTAGGNYRLQPTSPAIDAGTNAGCPATDLDGLPRPQGLACDMGAYEAIPVLFVDVDNISGTYDGRSWATAYPNLQDALNHASSGYEIWVADGVYYPDIGVGQTDNDRGSSFGLLDGATLYGGFAGVETARSQRDWAANITILSGDIDQNDHNADNNFIAEDTGDIQGNNTYHIVSSNGVSTAAVLDGFTITAGQANGTEHPDFYGGGMFNESSSPTLNNIAFSGNQANWGGGMFNLNNSNPALNNATFSGNQALYHGGGMYNYTARPTLNNIIFSGNQALLNSGGGMINNHASSPTLINVTFSGNQANTNGGGMANDNNSSPTLTNLIIWGNSSGSSSQIYNANGSMPTIGYSNIEGCGGGSAWDLACGQDGGGNIDANPLFVREPSGTDYGNLRLQANSPAIDTGDNANCSATDLDGLPRPNDGNADGTAVCDMGAYESGTQVCNVTVGSYSFPNQSGVNIEITTLGSELSCLYVDEMAVNHPHATGTGNGSALMTGRYWRIHALQSNHSTAANGYVATLSLPHDNLSNPKACRYTGGAGYGWECDATGSDASAVWRTDITAFSDWAVGDDVGPTAVTLQSISAKSITIWPLAAALILLLGVLSCAYYIFTLSKT